MKRRFLFGLLFLLVCRVFAADDQTGFRVVQERSDDGVTLMMQSDYCIEYTVTLEATLKNMTSSARVAFHGRSRRPQFLCPGAFQKNGQDAAVAIQLLLPVFQAIDGKKVLSLPFRLETDHGTFTEFIRGQTY